MGRHYQLYLMLLPAVVWYIIFSYMPMYGLTIAFKNYNPGLGILGSKWVGLKYFKSFFRSYYAGLIIKNTLILSVYSIVAGFPLPIILALMLNEVRSKSYKKVIQTVTYAPHFISMVVLVGMVIIFMTPRTGLIAKLIVMLGGDADNNLLASASAFRHIYVWSGVWANVGWSSVIYMAALAGVDPQLHEAAMIDGASRIQRVWHINLPILFPTMSIMLILDAGSVLSVGFEKVFLLQNDLNKDTSLVIASYVYERGLIQSDFSFSSAVTLFTNVVNFAIMITVNTIAGKLGNNSLF